MLRHSTMGSADTLVHKLFTLLIKYGNKGNQFYSNKLFGQDRNKNMRLLKHRMKRKILEALTSENNILRNNDLDKIDKEFYLSTKYLFTAKMLLRTSGNSKSALYLITKAEIKARKYEFYPIIVDCLTIKKYQSSLIKSPKDFQLINAEIEQNEYNEKLTNKAND